eukprot:1876211-Prymnesium_polylepis.2
MMPCISARLAHLSLPMLFAKVLCFSSISSCMLSGPASVSSALEFRSAPYCSMLRPPAKLTSPAAARMTKLGTSGGTCPELTAVAGTSIAT